MVVWYGLQCVVNFMKMCGKLHDCTGVVTGLPPRAGVRRHCGCAVTFCVLFAGLLITFLLPTAKSKCRSSIWQRKRAWYKIDFGNSERGLVQNQFQWLTA